MRGLNNKDKELASDAVYGGEPVEGYKEAFGTVSQRDDLSSSVLNKLAA